MKTFRVQQQKENVASVTWRCRSKNLCLIRWGWASHNFLEHKTLLPTRIVASTLSGRVARKPKEFIDYETRMWNFQCFWASARNVFTIAKLFDCKHINAIMVSRNSSDRIDFYFTAQQLNDLFVSSMLSWHHTMLSEESLWMGMQRARRIVNDEGWA